MALCGLLAAGLPVRPVRLLTPPEALLHGLITVQTPTSRQALMKSCTTLIKWARFLTLPLPALPLATLTQTRILATAVHSMAPLTTAQNVLVTACQKRPHPGPWIPGVNI